MSRLTTFLIDDDPPRSTQLFSVDVGDKVRTPGQPLTTWKAFVNWIALNPDLSLRFNTGLLIALTKLIDCRRPPE